MTEGMLRWFDNHCHLEPDSSVVDDAVAAGVARMITVGTDVERSVEAAGVARAHPGVVWATAGVHPHDARHGGIGAIAALLAEPEVIAVGECGLDYHYDHSPRDVQQVAFAAQIELANAADLPLVIHTREAWADTFAILGEVGTPRRTVFHCFTGGPDEARRCLEIGAHLSFSGIVTFKRSDDVRGAAVLCPLDRLLVETDSPYLAPVPHRGKRNQPAWVGHVGAGIAELRGVSATSIAEAAWVTTNDFYGLPE